MLTRLLGIALFAISLLLAWGWMEYRDFTREPLRLAPGGMIYSLKPGASVHSLAADLARRGVLEQPLFLRLLARQSGLASRLKAGEYAIPPGTTTPRLLEILSSGRVIQHTLTLVEGWTFKQMLAAIRRDPVLEQTLAGLGPKEIMRRLGHPGQDPEGRFYPDTYLFPRGSSDLAFLRRAYQRMQRLLADEWRQRQPGLPLKSPDEALILALPAERPQIAGVFIRRLRKGMRLQTDPTVIYGLGEAYDGNIRRRDLQRDTPYNTYLHKGLPPTPIAMPSGASIHAVLHPAEGDALYFVATGDGGPHFSASLQEHNRAVRRYQLKR